MFAEEIELEDGDGGATEDRNAARDEGHCGGRGVAARCVLLLRTETCAEEDALTV